MNENFTKLFEEIDLIRRVAHVEGDRSLEACLERVARGLNEIRLDYEWAETLLEFIEEDIGDDYMRASEEAANSYWSEKMSRERG